MCLNCNKAVLLHTTLRCPTDKETHDSFWKCNLGERVFGALKYYFAWGLTNKKQPLSGGQGMDYLDTVPLLHISNVSLHPLALQLKPI